MERNNYQKNQPLTPKEPTQVTSEESELEDPVLVAAAMQEKADEYLGQSSIQTPMGKQTFENLTTSDATNKLVNALNSMTVATQKKLEQPPPADKSLLDAYRSQDFSKNLNNFVVTSGLKVQ